MKVFSPLDMNGRALSGLPTATNADEAVRLDQLPDVSTIESNITALQSDVADAASDASSALTAANAAASDASSALSAANSAASSVETLADDVNAVSADVEGLGEDVTGLAADVAALPTVEEMNAAIAAAIVGKVQFIASFAEMAGNVTLNGQQTIDGQSTGDSSLVLLGGQTDPIENGLWVTNNTASPWTRPASSPTGTDFAGVYVSVAGGSTNGDKLFRCTNNVGAGVVGTSGLVFDEFNEATGGSGSASSYNGTITGDGSASLFTVTHNLGTNKVSVSVHEDESGSPGYSVVASWKSTGDNTVSVSAGVLGNGAVLHVKVLAIA
jgi:hypothetical protein